jgi:hypothetical protein
MIASRISRIFRVVESELHWHGICTFVNAVSETTVFSQIEVRVAPARECLRNLTFKNSRTKYYDQPFTPQTYPPKQPA